MAKVLTFPTPPPPEEPALPDFTIDLGRFGYQVTTTDRAKEPPREPPKKPRRPA